MGFPGTWMTESESVVYRVVPKCACSTIGQIMYYSDHGEFFDGDIHDATTGLHKWAREDSQKLINANVRTHTSYAFTCVRNPYTRILSSFFDKICGIQRNGKRYRGKLVPMLIQKYGIEVGGEDGTQEFDQIRSFRRFLLFARDRSAGSARWSPISTGRRSRAISRPSSSMAAPMTRSSGPRDSTRAWARCSPHRLAARGRSRDDPALQRIRGPRPKRAHPVEAYFDDLSMHLVYEIYKRDFEVFKYDFETPANKMPVRDRPRRGPRQARRVGPVA